MRTPIRLVVTITKFKIAQTFRRGKRDLPIRRILMAEETEKKSPPSGDSTRNNRRGLSASPILWLSGSGDPLAHPAIGTYTRQLQQRGHTVFLETDGMELRRRIHEFRPSERFYLTIRLYGSAHTHDQRLQRNGAFASAIEGLRAAQLSGFLLCAHVVVEHGQQLHDINLLLQQLCALNLDGVIITAADETAAAQRETVVAARSLMANRWWASFSQVLQRALNPTAYTFSGAVHAAHQMPGNSDLHPSPDDAMSSEEVAVP
jgi:hypothetical protein